MNLLVCDNCKAEIRGLHLAVEPRWDQGNTTLFLDGSWNGGEYCSAKCASDALSRVGEPLSVKKIKAR